MDKFIIEGGVRLKGRIRINGAKNSALPIMAATILGNGESNLSDVPRIRDVRTMCEMLRRFGAQLDTSSDRIKIQTDNIMYTEAPYEIIKTMRASFVVMGPLLAKLGKARVALPGGCAIGRRPVGLHLKGFRKLGAKIDIVHGYVEAKCRKLKGDRIYLDFPSVGATENLLMTATLAKGETVIENAAMEPEVIDLAEFLGKMGAEIEGAGTDVIRIQGGRMLTGGSHSIIPDRIEAGTFMIAA
ncbi:MAG: UDP-N-acetylglucosamine 1-carboxyvinyltransferase, partial [bacterium]|nr:UDP-N-acetylglucosamine 1-carboxyvinyltransferase [bacterium]